MQSQSSEVSSLIQLVKLKEHTGAISRVSHGYRFTLFALPIISFYIGMKIINNSNI